MELIIDNVEQCLKYALHKHWLRDCVNGQLTSLGFFLIEKKCSFVVSCLCRLLVNAMFVNQYVFLDAFKLQWYPASVASCYFMQRCVKHRWYIILPNDITSRNCPNIYGWTLFVLWFDPSCIKKSWFWTLKIHFKPLNLHCTVIFRRNSEIICIF